MSTVRVYDTKTEPLTSIPARELAPGMIRVIIEDMDGEVWVDANQLNAGRDYYHPPFEGKRRELMSMFADTFHDVYPRTAERWEDGFRRDENADKEIAMWVQMAYAFEHFTQGRKLSFEQRKDIFNVIGTAVNNGKEMVLLTMNPLTLSKKRVKEIVEFLFTPPPSA
jgi:hypothetical protein